MQKHIDLWEDVLYRNPDLYDPMAPRVNCPGGMERARAHYVLTTIGREVRSHHLDDDRFRVLLETAEREIIKWIGEMGVEDWEFEEYMDVIDAGVPVLDVGSFPAISDTLGYLLIVREAIDLL